MRGEPESVNPVVVTLTRGDHVESEHRGAVAVVSGTNELLFAMGDVQAPIYPRSAVKALQALPLIESGAAAAYGFGAAELALTCASHSGEERHIEVARTMMKKAGLSEEQLDCGTHWPFRRKDGCALTVNGQVPGPLHNNCSGKHLGMLATAKHLGYDLNDYVQPDHPLQQRCRDRLLMLTGEPHLFDENICGIDGCSVPTYAAPLKNLARAFAHFTDGNSVPFAAQLIDACQRNPFLVAGTGRLCTQVMQALAEHAFVKVGAEGVYCGAILGVSKGVGFAIKIDDGARRAAEVVLVNLLATLLSLSSMPPELLALGKIEQTNWQGRSTGALQISDALASNLSGSFPTPLK